jgi:putative ABC transport system permease protein
MIRLRAFWRNLRHRARVERELDEEMRATIELLVSEKMRSGMAADQARRAATMELGGIESVKQQVRDVRRGAFVDSALRDLRYAARLLWRNPLFTLTAALSLAIGIGSTTAIFTVANGLLLRAAAGVPNPEMIVDLVRRSPSEGPGVNPMSFPDLVDVRQRTTMLEEVFGYQLQLSPASLRVDDSTTAVFAGVVTSNYFRALRVAAAAGRAFDAGDAEQVNASPVAVLSHEFWMRRFAGDPGIVGRAVRINNVPLTIVGVSASGFRGLSIVAPDVWLPVSMITVVSAEGGGQELTNRQIPWLMLGARLKPGVSRARASAEVAAVGATIQRDMPPNPGVPPEFDGFTKEMDPSSFVWSAEVASPIPYGVRVLAAGFVGLLMALVGVVLVIACANLASVLLARATGRRREIAVRAAIGAGRKRIVRQLLTETVLLFALGGLAGLVLARVITRLLFLLLPEFPVPVNLSAPLDGRVVVFALVLSFIAAVSAGMAPALHASKSDVVTALKDEVQGSSDRMRLRNAFVIVQVAFSILLVVTAGLLVRAFDNVVSVKQGFDPRDVEMAALDLKMGGYTEATGRDVIRRLRERVKAIPGVRYASIADHAPGPSGMSFGSITLPGAADGRGRASFTTWTLVEPDYFNAVGIPLFAGREFTEDDRAGAELVVIVSQRTAKRLWADRDPVGQLVSVRAPQGPQVSTLQSKDPNTRVPEAQMRVVGVVGDVTFGNPEQPLVVYVPLQQKYLAQVTILARGPADRSLAQDLRSAVAAVDPNLPVLSAESLERQNNGPVQTQLRIAGGVAGSVGIIGLFLAGIGIYGVTAYTVAQRTREIGIRLSLGAGHRDVVRLVLGQGMWLVALGTIAGLALGLGAGKLLSGRQYGIPQFDPVVLAGAAVLFALIGLAACYVPVRRAVRIRATEALRYE